GFIMLDLDFFKQVNDQYGHQIGSETLKGVSQVILGSIRSVDWAARFGGDEFCIVLPETDALGTKAVADRVRGNIESHSFNCGPPAVRLTASVGLSVFESGLSPDTLVKRADIALYRAKAAGRNRVEVWR